MIRSVVDICLFARVKSPYSIKVRAMPVFCIQNVREKLLVAREMSGKIREIHLVALAETL